MPTDLTKLYELVAESLPFNEGIYPELKGASPEEKLRFAIRHSALHFAKTAGKVAAASEDMDHGGGIPKTELQSAAAKGLVNALRLAEVLQISTEELARLVKTGLATE